MNAPWLHAGLFLYFVGTLTLYFHAPKCETEQNKLKLVALHVSQMLSCSVFLPIKTAMEFKASAVSLNDWLGKTNFS